MVKGIAIASEKAIKNGKKPAAPCKLRYIDDLDLSHFALNIGLCEIEATLPSMRPVFVSCPCDLLHRWRCDSPMSNVTSLAIQDGGLQPDAPEQVLSHIKGLQKPYYEDS